MAKLLGISNLFARESRTSAPTPPPAPQDELFALKQNLLAQARENATGKPTLEDYRQACVAFAATEQGQQLAADGKFSPKIYADLQGQDLSGFAISDPFSQSKANTRPATDLMDLDGDNTISDFYTNISFLDANLKDSFVDPATSFNKEIGEAKDLTGLTFNGMAEGDVFAFNAGRYNDIKMTNINGGRIDFSGRVDGLSIEGKSAAITIGENAVLNHVQVSEDFRIISLDMAPGAILSNSDLQQATISMTSNVRGAVFQNVALHGNLDGLDLSGAKLNNLTVDGKPIVSREALASLGVTMDENTTVSASAAMVKQYELAQIRETMQTAIGSIGTTRDAPTPAQAAAPAQQVATAMSGQTSISGGESVSLAEALSSSYNPAKDLVARVQPEQGASMSMPGSGKA